MIYHNNRFYKFFLKSVTLIILLLKVKRIIFLSQLKIKNHWLPPKDSSSSLFMSLVLRQERNILMAISTLLISFASSLEMSRWRAFSKLMTTWTDSRESIPIYENVELLVISFGSHFEFSLITEIIFFSTSSSNTL